MRRLALDTMDVPAVQAWLEDYAARGWYLESYGFYRVKFVRGEPRENVRYRLQPTGPQAGLPDPDIREAYGEMGWRYVCSSTSGWYSFGPRTEFHIWRCDDPDTPELDTDQALREEAYGELLRRSRRNIWLVVPMLLAALAVMWWLVWDRPRQYLLGGYTFDSSSFLLCWNIVLALYLVSGSARLIRFTRRLRREEPAPQRAPWGRAAVRAWGLPILYVLLLALTFGSLSHGNDPRPYLPVSQYEEAVPYVSLSELGTPAGEEAEAVDFHSVWGRSVWWTAEGDSDDTPYCHTEYYGLRFPSMAEKLEEQLLRQWRDWEDGDQPGRQIAVLGTDSAWYWRWEDALRGPRQTMILRRDGQVLEVFYRGEADLLEHTEQYAAMLDRFQS